MAVAKSTRNAYLAIAVVLALGVVIFANLLADRGFVRVDLTAERKYSLSEPFRSVMGRLGSSDQLKVTYCVSKSVPEWFEGIKRDILDRLREIETASRGRIILEVVDPEDNEDLKKELEKQNLNFTVQTREKGKLSYMVINSSLRLTYADKPSDWVQVVRDAQDLEYDIANKVYTLTQEKKPVVAIQRPKPEQPPMMMGGRQPPNPFGWLLGDPDTAKKVEVKDIELTENSTIPDDAKLLILIRPAELGERARYEVIRYLAGGGRVLLLSSSFKITNDMFAGGVRVQKTPTGLESYLQDIGVTPDMDFVCDENNLRLPVELNPFTGEVKYAVLSYFVQIQAASIYQESPITRSLRALVMPYPSTLAIDEQKMKAAGLNVTVLAKTSSLSWKEPYSDTFDPRKFDSARAGRDPGLPVFIQLEGAFPFPWEGKDVPAWSATPDEKDAAGEKKAEEKKAEAAKATVERKQGAKPILFLWTCPESFDRMYLEDRQIGSELEGNIHILPNIVESCALGEDLINLRAKRLEARTIEAFDKKEDRSLKFALKVFMIGGTAILLVVSGLVYWFVRRSGQVRYERAMSQSGPSSFMP
jgi:ABC-2 type transport system permease protein